MSTQVKDSKPTITFNNTLTEQQNEPIKVYNTDAARTDAALPEASIEMEAPDGAARFQRASPFDDIFCKTLRANTSNHFKLEIS